MSTGIYHLNENEILNFGLAIRGSKRTAIRIRNMNKEAVTATTKMDWANDAQNELARVSYNRSLSIYIVECSAKILLITL